MRRICTGLVSVFTMGVAIFGLTGCPWWVVPGQQVFTSADVGNSRGLFDVVAGAGEEPEDTQNEVADREVVEPDVIRRAGNLLYVLNQYRGLSIVDLDGESLLAQVPTYGYPRDLYLEGNRAYVLVGYAQDYTAEGSLVHVELGSRLYVVDVEDAEAPAIINSFDLEGDFVDSRMVGDVLYAVSAEFAWSWDTAVAVEVFKEQTSSSWVTSVNVADSADIHVVGELSFEGYGDIIQATSSAIFVAASDWSSDTTAITYVDISDPAGAIAVRGGVTVQGRVADRFKMNAYDGVLRVVSSTSWPVRDVYVTTVNLANPDVLGVLGETTIPGAAGETLFATRFDGPRAYVVTYLIVDPLFVLDLSDPANPLVAGELEVPGWSTHIEPQGDRLVALGVDDSDGRQVSVSLFDVADPAAPGLIDRVSFGEGWSWSSAYTDVKALTVMDDMILVPFSGWSKKGGFERIQFVSYTPGGLTLEGFVDLEGTILRSFDYNGLYYGVTSEQLATIDATDTAVPAVTNRLTLAEYLADYHELAPGVAAEIVSHYDRQEVTVRTVDAAGQPLGSTDVALPDLAASYVYGDDVILVGREWDDHGFYSVYWVDCGDPAAPAVRERRRVNAEPFWGWRWYYDMPVDARENVPGKDLWYPHYGDASDTTFLVDGILVLRCYAEEYDVVYGEDTPYQGVALVDLDAVDWTSTAGFGFEAQSIDAVGDKLYIGSKETAGVDLLLRPLCAYYVRAFDPAGPAMGPAANVPGSFVQYDAASEILVLEDVQFSILDEVWEVRRDLRSVTWDEGDTASAVDSAALPEGVGQLHGRGARIYYESYEDGQTIGVIDVDDSGDLALGERVQVTKDVWAWLVDARGDSAYVAIGGGAIARYDFSGDAALTDLVPVMGSPLRIRFGADAAYAPLGYAGLAVLPL